MPRLAKRFGDSRSAVLCHSRPCPVDAAIEDQSGPRHQIFALSLKDGSTLEGWPIDVANSLRAKGLVFNPRDQNQRAALTLLDDVLYVPFGGHFGDCGDYHGWVIAVPLHDPGKIISWQTRARGGGIWAPDRKHVRRTGLE